MNPIVGWMWLVAVLALAFMAVRAVRVRVQVGPIRFHDLRATSEEAHERIGEYLRANFGGDPAALGHVVHDLLPLVRDIGARHGVELDDDLLRTVIVTSIAAHHVASRAQAEAAFEAALHPERGAA